MPLNNLNSLLVHELKDIYSAEKQISRALPKMAKAASDPKLRQAFEKHLDETKRQIEKLDDVFGQLDATPGRHVCKAIQGILAEGEELLEKHADKIDPAVLDAALIAQAQRVEHYEIAVYGTLRTYAQELGLDKPARTLSEILEEEKRTDVKLTELAQGGINQEANGEGGQAAGAGTGR